MKIRFVVHFTNGEVIEGRPFVGAYCNTPLPFLSPLERGEKGVCNTPPAPLDRGEKLGTGWRHLPDKPIAELSLVNPHGDLITLKGYEEYNFMVESLQALGQASYMSDVYVMGARDGKVVVYRMRVSRKSLSDPVQVGDIMVKVTDRGKEYLGAETTGWRKGMLKIRHLLGGGLKSSNV